MAGVSNNTHSEVSGGAASAQMGVIEGWGREEAGPGRCDVAAVAAAVAVAHSSPLGDS